MRKTARIEIKLMKILYSRNAPNHRLNPPSTLQLKDVLQSLENGTKKKNECPTIIEWKCKILLPKIEKIKTSKIIH